MENRALQDLMEFRETEDLQDPLVMLDSLVLPDKMETMEVM